MGSCVLQLLDVLQAGTRKKKKKEKKLFLTAWRSVDLDSSSALYTFYCACAVTVFAVCVWMGRAVFLALAHLGKPHYPLKGVSAAG